ncbi:MAG: hypothetical protein NZM35_12150, partial [Chitinophagales bacterium]|nr:hypothetical protein [Chitinophagales bacterium]
LITLDLFLIQIMAVTPAQLCCLAQYMGFRGACLGEGCGGRERSEAAAPAPLKNKLRAGAAEATAYPVASPTPLRRVARRSAAAGAPHKNTYADVKNYLALFGIEGIYLPTS